MDVLNRYRNHSNSSSDDDSEDSDKECTVWKRAVKKVNDDHTFEKVQVEEVSSEPIEKSKRRKNNIWSDILQDQLMSDDLNSVLLKNKPANYGSRGQESYDYTLKYSDPRAARDSDIAMSEEEVSEPENKSLMPHNSFKSNKYNVELDNAEKDAVRKINKVLNEKKTYIIGRAVKYLGMEKAIALLKMTEEIEENGGMMIANHSRRRTPGGVYIQLLKTDKDITKEVLDKIFEGEMTAVELKKFMKEQKKKNKRFRKKKCMNRSRGKQTPKPEAQEMESIDDMETCVKEKADLILENNPISAPELPVKNTDSELEDGEIED